jgi:hypothetical protein
MEDQLIHLLLLLWNSPHAQAQCPPTLRKAGLVSSQPLSHRSRRLEYGIGWECVGLGWRARIDMHTIARYNQSACNLLSSSSWWSFSSVAAPKHSQSEHVLVLGVFFYNALGKDLARRLASPVSFTLLSARRFVVARCLCRSVFVLTSCLHSLAEPCCVFPPPNKAPGGPALGLPSHSPGRGLQ